MASTITIDGFVLYGSAKEILTIQSAVMGWLRKLEKKGWVSTFMPITGRTDTGERTAQIVRLRLQSTVSITIVDDGTMPASLYDGMESSAAEFIETGTEEAQSMADRAHEGGS